MLDRCRPLAVTTLLLACAAAPVPSEAPHEPAWTDHTPDPPVLPTRGRLEKLLVEIEIERPSRLTAEQLEAVRGAGFEAWELIELVEPLISSCHKSAWRCDADKAEALALVLLGWADDPRARDMVASLALLGAKTAVEVREAILERRAIEAMASGRCEPPSAAELAAARHDLVDFRTLEATQSGRLRPRQLTAAELDDLAYFMVVVAHAGLRVGWGSEEVPSSPDESWLAALTRVTGDWDAALLHGNLDGVQDAGWRHLELLGWPGPLQVPERLARGTAPHSERMRDLAWIAELRGRHDEARELWTRARTTGICGMDTHRKWLTQMKGSIRAAERSGDCRAAIAERLLDISAVDRWSFGGDAPAERYESGFDYGLRRLAAAGFDIPRLYRGALLTRNRNEDPRELAAAIEGPEQDIVRARLRVRGNEAWEVRVRAIEGLADTLGESALDPLLELLAVGDVSVRWRVLSTIGQAAERPAAGVCDPQGQGFAGSSGSYRVVHRFGYNCATQLDDNEVSALAKRLLPYLRDPEPKIRIATAEVFVDLVALDTLAALRKQAAREAKRAAVDEDAEWVLDELRDSIAALEQARLSH